MAKRKRKPEPERLPPPIPDHKQHIGNHHIVPRSRGGPDVYWNSFSWSSVEERDEKHPLLHVLIYDRRRGQNLLPSEFIEKIRAEWTAKDGSLLKSALTAKQQIAWDAVFGPGTPPNEAIDWLEQNFLPVERRWQRLRERQSRQGRKRGKKKR